MTYGMKEILSIYNHKLCAIPHIFKMQHDNNHFFF